MSAENIQHITAMLAYFLSAILPFLAQITWVRMSILTLSVKLLKPEINYSFLLFTKNKGMASTQRKATQYIITNKAPSN